MKAAIAADPSKESRAKEEEEEEEDPVELRRGPWTVEEDGLLTYSIACHGEGHWNSLAKAAGLKRTGKSCRLRWLNYLKPDIKRGNLTPQEQLLILELHSKWGNRWSKIAANLPGRTDNEIKNYWRTRVQKQARQLNMESSSQRFIDAIRCFYMPRLVEKEQNNSSCSLPNSTAMNLDGSTYSLTTHQTAMAQQIGNNSSPSNLSSTLLPGTSYHQTSPYPTFGETVYDTRTKMDSLLLDVCYHMDSSDYDAELTAMSATRGSDDQPSDSQVAESNWLGDEIADDMWNLDDLWQFKK
ncbi:hypothetical protein Nepgr_017046 [Nepenthes gracilis]|uniref:Uncharacterized protein n=1 Tax=Nepenthes gracilis TaxID=150966 RepID=A0AAD3SQW1_NEPGR|nr:hypothetical protein Nepgr_017046 [Nepenthes gracilis]